MAPLLSVWNGRGAPATIAAILYLCAAGCSPNVANLTIINKSGGAIKSCVVKLNKDIADFGSLAVGASTSRRLRVWSDGDYDLTVQFANGKRLHEQLGYVTNGFDFTDTIVIYGDRAELKAQNAPRQ